MSVNFPETKIPNVSPEYAQQLLDEIGRVYALAGSRQAHGHDDRLLAAHRLLAAVRDEIEHILDDVPFEIRYRVLRESQGLTA